MRLVILFSAAGADWILSVDVAYVDGTVRKLTKSRDIASLRHYTPGGGFFHLKTRNGHTISLICTSAFRIKIIETDA